MKQDLQFVNFDCSVRKISMQCRQNSHIDVDKAPLHVLIISHYEIEVWCEMASISGS